MFIAMMPLTSYMVEKVIEGVARENTCVLLSLGSKMHRALGRGIKTDIHLAEVSFLILVHQMPDYMVKICTAYRCNASSLEVWHIGNSFHLFVAKICDGEGG